MWRTDESGEFTFSDATDANPVVCVTREASIRSARKAAPETISRKGGSLSQIEEFVLAGNTVRETHYKRVVDRNRALGSPRVNLDCEPRQGSPPRELFRRRP